MTSSKGKVYFIGAGPGDPELLTLKAKRILEQADVLIYADSLVNQAICKCAKRDAEILGSSSYALEEIISVIVDAVKDGKTVARIHTGDPSIYGALHEQLAALDKLGIEYEIIPGVSSIFAAAASLKAELTVPEVSQTVVITRLQGRTPVPPEQKLASLAAHKATMVILLSVSMIDRVTEELIQGGFHPSTPAAVVYRASWEDERKIMGTLADIGAKVREAGIDRQALIIVGHALKPSATVASGCRSKLYDKAFSHSRRAAITIDDENDQC